MGVITDPLMHARMDACPVMIMMMMICFPHDVWREKEKHLVGLAGRVSSGYHVWWDPCTAMAERGKSAKAGAGSGKRFHPARLS